MENILDFLNRLTSEAPLETQMSTPLPNTAQKAEPLSENGISLNAEVEVSCGTANDLESVDEQQEFSTAAAVLLESPITPIPEVPAAEASVVEAPPVEEQADGELAKTLLVEETVMSEEEREEHLQEVLDDRGIVIDKSPFRTFPDDKQVFEKRTSLVELRRIILQYQNGEITERMLYVLEIIIRHKNITSRQIWQLYLLEYGKYIKRDHLSRTLEQMVARGLVGQFRIFSAQGKSNYYVYTPEYNGVRLFSAVKELNTNWKKTDTLQKPYNIKKCLAANQFLIAFLKNYKVSYRIQESLSWTAGNGVLKSGSVRPSLELTFKQENEGGQESIVFLVEAIRIYQGWEDDFREKLKRYGMYLESVKDTQVLKRYYIIICSESDDQLAEAVRQVYEVIYKQHMYMVNDRIIYHITDTKLLDNNIGEDLVHNLHAWAYDQENNSWDDWHAECPLPKWDWHKLDFEVDRKLPPIPTTQPTLILDAEKEKIVLDICNVLQEESLDFPFSITKLALPLKRNKIEYQDYGYHRLKDMFVDLSEYFALHYTSPTELMVEPTTILIELLKKKPPKPPKPRKIEQNIIEEYILKGMAGKKKWSQQFRNKIYTRNWKVSAALINQMTQIYDFSEEGWYNILAYSYQVARTKGIVMQEGKYFCFDIGIQTSTCKKMYLLAEKNPRIKPEWVLVGIATLESNRLGRIIQEEFGHILGE